MRRIVATDREVAEIEDGHHKVPEKRQMERNGRLAMLRARYADRGNVGRFLRAISRNYMRHVN